jgi:hypothetical protein
MAAASKGGTFGVVPVAALKRYNYITGLGTKSISSCEAKRLRIAVFCVSAQQTVRVQCLRCGHFGVLTAETLSRLAIAPSTPIAAFVKRLRCRRCGSQSVPWKRQRALPGSALTWQRPPTRVLAPQRSRPSQAHNTVTRQINDPTRVQRQHIGLRWRIGSIRSGSLGSSGSAGFPQTSRSE